MWNQIYTDRLLKLATHLRVGVLGHDKFDFGKFSSGERNSNGCGTNGCALGECPIVFKEWGFPSFFKDVPLLNDDLSNDPYTSAMKFFDLSSLEASFLFQPVIMSRFAMYDSLSYVAMLKPSWSSKEEIAERIERFVDYKLNKSLEAREYKIKQKRDALVKQRSQERLALYNSQKALVNMI